MRLLKLLALVAVFAAFAAVVAQAEPERNLEAILRPAAGGPEGSFGLVRFRQPKDEDKIAYLDVWVRNLEPNHAYSLQRAVDTAVDDVCTGTNWLTLGEGLVPKAIETSDRGTGRAALFRDLAAIAEGTEFDIHFRVVETATMAVVLETGCYQFTVSQ